MVQHRQGDVYFEAGDSQYNRAFFENEKDLVAKEDKTVALGEATGHHHTFSGGATVLRRPEEELKSFGKLVKIEEPAEIKHQQHRPIPFEGIGEFTVTHQRVATFSGLKKVTD